MGESQIVPDRPLSQTSFGQELQELAGAVVRRISTLARGDEGARRGAVGEVEAGHVYVGDSATGTR